MITSSLTQLILSIIERTNMCEMICLRRNWSTTLRTSSRTRILTKPLNPRMENSRPKKFHTWKVNKLAESFSQTSGNESSPDHLAIRNSQVGGKQVPWNQVNPRDAQIKPASSRKVWTKLRSGLFGWKYIKSVSVPPKPSHGKTSKIVTQNKPKNFEVRSVARNLEILPQKITFYIKRTWTQGSHLNKKYIFNLSFFHKGEKQW